MLGIQAYVFFGPPPTSDRAAASTALIVYAVFATVIWWLQDRPGDLKPNMARQTSSLPSLDDWAPKRLGVDD